MQLGKSLMGAIIGGVLGIGVLLVVHALVGWDAYWMALPVALLTGLGVRWVANVKGHPSYLRGALTGILAIAAFIAGQYVVAQVATRGAPAKPVTTQESAVRPALQDQDAVADEATVATDEPEGDGVATDEPAADPPTLDGEATQPAADEQAEPATGEQAEPAADEPAEPAADEQALPAPREPADAGSAEGMGGAPTTARTPLAKQWTTVDLVWLCIAALIGYSLGRGSEPAMSTGAESHGNIAPNRAMPPSD
jgi:hypothetical protein